MARSCRTVTADVSQASREVTAIACASSPLPTLLSQVGSHRPDRTIVSVGWDRALFVWKDLGMRPCSPSWATPMLPRRPLLLLVPVIEFAACLLIVCVPATCRQSSLGLGPS